MALIKKILEFLAHSLIIVGFVAISMSFTSSVILGIDIDIKILLISFLIFFSIYSINRKTDIKEDIINNENRAYFIRNYGKMLNIIGILFYPIAFFIGLLISPVIAFSTLIPILIGILYSVKWVPESLYKYLKFRRLKDILIVKNMSVAFTWAFTILLLITLSSNVIISSSIIFILFIFFFIRVFVNTVMFDMRDVRGDMSEEVKTIPIIFGEKNTKKMLTSIIILLMIFIFLVSFIMKLNPIMYLINFSSFYALFYIYLFDKSYVDKNFLCDVVIDGEYLLIGILVLIGFLLV